MSEYSFPLAPARNTSSTIGARVAALPRFGVGDASIWMEIGGSIK